MITRHNCTRTLLLTVFCFLLTLCQIAHSATTEELTTYTHGKHIFSVGLAPSWVKPVKVPKPKGPKDGQGQEFALLDSQVRALGGTDYQKYYNSSNYLHTSQAVAEGSEVHISYNPAYQDLTIHKIDIVRKGKILNSLIPDAIRLIQREEDLRNGIYDGVITAVAIVPNTRTGDRLDFSYTVSGRNPVYGDKIFDAFSLGWSVDVGLTTIRLLAPSNRKLETRLHGIDIKEKRRKRGTLTEYTWTAKEIAGRPNEGDYPAAFQRYAWLEVSEFENWKEVQLWASKMYASIDSSSQELSAVIEDLEKSSRDNFQYTSQALKFAQEEIRYLGLEFGQNSHLPHSPQEVLERRFGDCKDKSNLLTQILKARGIEADSTLVSNQYRSGIESFLPSPLAFDHVIVRAVVNGNVLWLDPTRTFQGEDANTIGFINYGKGLIINQESEGSLKNISRLDSQNDSVSSTEHFFLDSYKSEGQLTIKTVYSGNQAENQRYHFSNNSIDTIGSQYQSYYSNTYPEITLASPIALLDDKNLNKFTTIEKYIIPKIEIKSDDFYTISFFAATINQNLAEPQQRVRKTPIYIGSPRKINHRIIVDFKNPNNLEIDSTPLIIVDDNIEYRSRSAYFRNRFEFSVDLTIKESHIDSEIITDYLSKISKIKDDINFTLTYSKENSKTVNNGASTNLKQKLLKNLEAAKDA